MKNVLVIGGSYFVGRVFVEELAKESDYRIYVLNRGSRPLNMEGVAEIVCDRNNVAQLKENIPSEKWDAVVDFCAYYPNDIEGMLSALSQHDVGQYIYLSTSSVYKKTLSIPVREDAPKLAETQPELGTYSDYAFNKWRSEIRLMELCAGTNIHYTSLRPAIIYGKYNYAPRESYFFDLIHQGKTIALPDNPLPLFTFVSVWDVVKIIIACIGNEKVFDRAFNLAAPDMVSYRRLVEVLGEIMGKKIRVRTMSVEAIDEKKIPLPFPLDDHLIYSGALIRQVLGIEYTPFVEGMRKAWQYYSGCLG
jgi:Nucleoside-diphosphate-sugar epimerases